jgi:3-oxoacyl-[acyl-carrier protein] reductase
MSPPIPPRSPPRDLLKGKTAVVTAAAGAGIGYAAASRFAEEGAEVLISDIHERRLAEAADKLAAETGRRPATFLCDVSVVEQVTALEAEARRVLGQVDVLVNNAGLGTSNSIVEMTDDQWRRVLSISLDSVFYMCRAFLPDMYARKAGVIVNNASVLGWRAQPLQAHYAAAKAGVMAFTRCAGIEAAEHGVRVNAVAPSIVMHEFLSRSADADFLKDLLSKEAFNRGAEPWEVANVMLFLASDLSSYMTGEVVSVSSQRA